MRIECPECKARYEVPDERLQPGRTVRCARCGHDWTPVPPPPVVEPAPVPPPPIVEDPMIEATPARPRPPHPFLVPPRAPLGISGAAPAPLATAQPLHPGRNSLALAWLLTLAVLAASGWAFVAFRADIAQAWPPSQRIYDAVGLPAPPPPR